MAISDESSGTEEVVVRPATFAQLTTGETRGAEVSTLGLMSDVSVTLSAEFGKAVLPLGDVLKLGVGSVVNLDRLVSEPVELSVKGVLLARGEVVVVDDRFAVRIKEIVQPLAHGREAGMRAWPILAVAWLLLLPVMTVSAAEGLTYTPPVCPEPPAVGPLLLRLGLATVAVLGLCAGMMWLGWRRGLLVSAPPLAGKRLRLMEAMSLSGGSFLYLIEAGDKQYVAGVNRGSLQVLVPLTEPFDQARRHTRR